MRCVRTTSTVICALACLTFFGCATGGNDASSPTPPPPDDGLDASFVQDAGSDVDAGMDADASSQTSPDAGKPPVPVVMPCDAPMGTYQMDVTSVTSNDPDYTCSLNQDPADFVWTPVPAPESNNGCTLSADQYSGDGCAFRQTLHCTDGSGWDFDCILNKSASQLRCTWNGQNGICTTKATLTRTACPDDTKTEGKRCIPPCPTGEAWTGQRCVDVDECALGYCADHGLCTNQQDSYSCQCDAGYQQMGHDCVLVDACAAAGKTCHAQASCDTSGAMAECVCNQGYVGNGASCTDDDECARNACGQFSDCTNTTGSYTCGPIRPYCDAQGHCSCPDGKTPCGDDCVDVQTDRDHCGACNATCQGPTQQCTGGQCLCDEAGTEPCGTECVYLNTSLHCGTCDNACTAAGTSCVAGKCECPDQYPVVCNDLCVDVTTDERHCGGCGQACPSADQTCQNSQCACPHDSDVICSGRCVSLQSREHCGACDQRCTLCDESCVRIQQLAVAQLHTCTVMTNGELYCWGYNGSGEAVATDPDTQVLRPVRVQLTDTTPLASVAAGASATCALHTNGHVSCWGYNASGRLGAGTGTFSGPVQVQLDSGGLLAGVTQVAGGTDHFCARTSDGLAYCWGEGESGQPGHGTFAPAPFATRVETAAGVALTDVEQLIVYESRTCAIQTSGEAYCWGYNGSGVLGDGSTDNQPRPMRLEVSSNVPLTDVQQIEFTFGHSCARLGSGEVYCWGYGAGGQLGDGSDQARTRPVRVEVSAGQALTGVTEIALGPALSCARRTSGEVWCWGANTNGSLGIGSLVQSNRPVRVELSAGVALDHVAHIVSSPDLTLACAIQESGQLLCWGYNALLQLGDGTNTDRSRPVKVGGTKPLGPVSHVQFGEFSACALLQNGDLSCWGDNREYTIGDGTNTNRPTPVVISWP